ncbi:glycosyl transferase family 90-domain-containing protein [Xylariaceae sp. FL1019]|nr:glycosyl transferase family 90-domain-containing protein [Xylariaceae sp. FL1019]
MRRKCSSQMFKLVLISLSCLSFYIWLATRAHGGFNPLHLEPDDVVAPVTAPLNDFDILNLSESECRTIFRDLFIDLDKTVALGPFTLKRAQDTGPVQVRVKYNRLYILKLEETGILSPELVQIRKAALYQIHRALLTSPLILPDTVFSLNIRDQPYGAALSYTRPAYRAHASALPPLERAFLMPHFSHWTWDLPSIGSIRQASKAITQIEDGLAFKQKDSRVVWRGTTGFNGIHHPTLRQDLLKVTNGADWADVQALDSYTLEKDSSDTDSSNTYSGARDNNILLIEDFCRYKYILYTDGVTYSGRLSFHQLCGSVLITPPIAWLQHTTHLIKPLFSCDLNLDGPQAWTPDRGVSDAWPVHYRPEDANAVFVSPDWTDLEDTIRWLEEHQDVAEGIAKRQRELYVEKGYLSPAAEVCFWRALITGWSDVVRFDEEQWDKDTGIRWEEFSIGEQ